MNQACCAHSANAVYQRLNFANCPACRLHTIIASCLCKDHYLSVQTPLDLYKQRGFKTLTDPVLAINQATPTLRLTVWETGEQFIPVQQIGKLGLGEFSKLYTVSALKHC